MSEKILKINNLIVSFENPDGELTAVKGVSLSLNAGETLALVGESGCGKTVLCKSMLKILCDKGRIRQGEIMLDGENLVPLSEAEMQDKRGADIAMVFQDPMTSLDPAFSVGEQIAEVLRIHKGFSAADAKAQAVELMNLVQIPEAEKRYDQRPYQFSGGMRQRIVIAIALAAEPEVLLADEPTTALDEQTQEEILKLLKNIQERTGVAILFITHDLSIVEDIADRVAIMKDGLLVECGNVSEVFAKPEHEYTKKLLGYLDYKKNKGHNHRGRQHVGITELDEQRCFTGYSAKSLEHVESFETLISVRNLNVYFTVGRRLTNHVLQDFNLDIHRGEIVGVVGKSGCGKSTLARCIMGLEKYDGTISVQDGIKTQMIFQDTGAAFNDRMTVSEIIAEPLIIAGGVRGSVAAKGNENIRLRVEAAMNAVELELSLMGRKPYELSGGQRQRVAIARALITEPDVIIADEPLTGLDVSTQAQIVHLFKKLSEEKNLAILFIAHDLPMVNHVSNRIVQM